MNEAEYLTADEAAALLKVSTRTVYNALRNGRLKGVKLGGWIWRTKREWVEEFGRPNFAQAA